MKQKVGIIIACILAVILLIGGAIYVYLFHNIDPETRKQIEETIGTITDQVDEQIQTEKDQLEEATSEEGEEDIPGSAELVGGASEVISSGTESLTKKTASIIEIYYGGMQKLEGEGNAIVNQLVANAKADYKRIKADGGGKDQLMSLASAYSNQASAMESGMDSSVEGLLSRMKNDLTAAGMSKKDADKIVSQLRSEYKSRKNARYNEVYSEFQAALS